MNTDKGVVSEQKNCTATLARGPLSVAASVAPLATLVRVERGNAR